MTSCNLAAAGGMVDVTTTSRIISQWFPSISAIACIAGLFSFTITGVPFT